MSKLIRKTLAISEDDMKLLGHQAIDAGASKQSYLEDQIKLIAEHGPYEAQLERNELLEIQLRKLSK